MTNIQRQFDVFLAHNSEDKSVVRTIANKLRQRGLNPWIDEEELQPGKSIHDEIQKVIPQMKSAAIFFGPHGVGRWQKIELRTFFSMLVDREISVIPVLLPGVTNLPEDLHLIKDLGWVSFSADIEDVSALDRLEWGITGQKPERILHADQIPGKVPSKQFLQDFSSSPSKLLKFETARLTLKSNGIKVTTRTCQVNYFSENLGLDIALEMVEIPHGRFTMGIAEVKDESTNRSAYPIHQVEVETFYMSKYLITQEQWGRVANSFPKSNSFLKTQPSEFKGSPKLPVEQISWFDAVEFCERLTKITGRNYRLPSEAEWEYACRAGTVESFYVGDLITTDIANYNGDNSYIKFPEGVYRRKTTQVTEFSPNPFGLHDMHGNLREWCADIWHESYVGAPLDGSAWTDSSSQFRLLRGGSWSDPPENCRSAYRTCFYPDGIDSEYGFRVVCDSF